MEANAKVKLRFFPFYKMRRQRVQATLTVLAIAVTVLATSILMTALGLFNRSVQNYYEPLKDYNLIMEKKGNLVQFVPLDSTINSTTIADLDVAIEEELYPSVFHIVEETVKSVIPNVLVGFHHVLVDHLLDVYGIDEGRVPEAGKRELLVGTSVQVIHGEAKLGDIVPISGENFTIVGRATFDNPVMNNFFITTYSDTQESLGLNGSCNLIFIATIQNETRESMVETLVESHASSLKFINQAEIDVISKDIIFMSSEWNEFLVIFTFFIGITFPLSIFYINYEIIKKEQVQLQRLGTPRGKIVLFRLSENLLSILLGVAIGYLMTIFIYPMITNVAWFIQEIDFDPVHLYWHTFVNGHQAILTGFFHVSVLLLLVGPLLVTLPYAVMVYYRKVKSLNRAA